MVQNYQLHDMAMEWSALVSAVENFIYSEVLSIIPEPNAINYGNLTLN